MSRAPIEPTDLPAELLRREKQIKAAIGRGIRNGARRARTKLVQLTPKDTGLMKAAWRDTTVRTDSGVIAEVFNDAPYAGIVESGARPHGVSAAGRLAIYEWAKRHFPDRDEKALKGIVFAIVKKLREKGQAPTYFVRDALPELREYTVEEIVRELTKVADAPKAPS